MDGYQVFIMSEGTDTSARQVLIKILFDHLRLEEVARIWVMPVDLTIPHGVSAWIEAEINSISGQLEDGIVVQRAQDETRGRHFLCPLVEIQTKLPAPGGIVIVIAPARLISKSVKWLGTDNGIIGVGNGRTFYECI